jgi:hypothetical protein
MTGFVEGGGPSALSLASQAFQRAMNLPNQQRPTIEIALEEELQMKENP